MLLIKPTFDPVKSSSFYHLKRILALRHCTTFKQLEILVHAFVTSRMDYCNSLLYGAPSYLLDTYQGILNDTARALIGVSRHNSSSRILKQLHWLPIRARILFKLATIAHRILYHQRPVYLANTITVKISQRSTRSSNAPLLVSEEYLSQKRTVRYGDRSAHYSICHAFNNLPSNIRSISNFNSFKSAVKTHLFSLSYS